MKLHIYCPGPLFDPTSHSPRDIQITDSSDLYSNLYIPYSCCRIGWTFSMKLITELPELGIKRSVYVSAILSTSTHQVAHRGRPSNSKLQKISNTNHGRNSKVVRFGSPTKRNHLPRPLPREQQLVKRKGLTT